MRKARDLEKAQSPLSRRRRRHRKRRVQRSAGRVRRADALARLLTVRGVDYERVMKAMMAGAMLLSLIQSWMLEQRSG